MMKFTYGFATLLLGFSLLAITITSCDSDDDITGTYTLTLISSSQCFDPMQNLSFDLSGDGCQIIDGEEVCITGTMTLTETTFVFTVNLSSDSFNQTDTDSGDYTIEGNIITICYPDGCESTMFSINNNELALDLPADGDGCVFTLKGKK